MPQIWECQVYQSIINEVKIYIDNNILIFRDLNVALSTTDKTSKRNISKEMRTLNDTLDQMDFTDIYKTLCPNAIKYIFFSSAHGTLSRIDLILGHKSVLNQYQKIGMVPCIFSDHNAVKLELNQN